jgi:hypothetical protein
MVTLWNGTAGVAMSSIPTPTVVSTRYIVIHLRVRRSLLCIFLNLAEAMPISIHCNGMQETPRLVIAKPPPFVKLKAMADSTSDSLPLVTAMMSTAA